MIIEDNADPIDIRAGVWKHYKGELYLVEGYSQDVSHGNNLQIIYVPLYTKREHTGARKITRNWREFFETVCTVHDGMVVHGREHFDLVQSIDEGTCVFLDGVWVERFVYMGPVYYKGLES